jgi:hypothetical protein
MSLRFYRWRDRQSQLNLFAVLSMVFFYGVFSLQNGWSPAVAGGGVAVFVISALLLWRHWLLKQEEIEFTTNRTLVIHRRSWSGKPTKSTHALDDFGAIRSYLTVGSRRINRLEIVMVAGGEALLIASRAPAEKAAFWHLAGESFESPEILNVRAEISSRWGLVDHGFQGSRWVGATIKGSE